MSYDLTPSLIPVNGQFIETYSRISKASNDIKTELGLSADEAIQANIGITSIEEFIVLQAVGIPRNTFRYWDLQQIGQSVKLESIYIDSPQSDKFEFSILDRDENEIFRLSLNRNKTPYELPDAPLPEELVLRIKATSDIALVRIVCRPVVILEYIDGLRAFPVSEGQQP